MRISPESIWWPKKEIKLVYYIDRLLNYASTNFQGYQKSLSESLKAVTVPNAGLAFSGLCAAAGYLEAKRHEDEFETIVLILPNLFNSQRHYMTNDLDFGLDGDGFATLSLDRELFQLLDENFLFETSRSAFREDSSFHLQLPFLGRLFPTKKLLPLMIGKKGFLSKIAKFLEKRSRNLLYIVVNNLTDLWIDTIPDPVCSQMITMDDRIMRKITSSHVKPPKLEDESMTSKEPFDLLHQLVIANDYSPGCLCYYNSLMVPDLDTNYSYSVPRIQKRHKSHQLVVGYGAIAFYYPLMTPLLTQFEATLTLRYLRQLVENRLTGSRELLKLPYLRNLQRNDPIFIAWFNPVQTEPRSVTGQLISSNESIIDQFDRFTQQMTENSRRYSALIAEELPTLKLSLTILGHLKSMTLDDYYHEDSLYRPERDCLVVEFSHRNKLYSGHLLPEKYRPTADTKKTPCDKEKLLHDLVFNQITDDQGRSVPESVRLKAPDILPCYMEYWKNLNIWFHPCSTFSE